MQFDATRLAGLKIEGVRHLTDDEMVAMDWDGPKPVVLLLSNGAALLPQRDPEGNGPGFLLLLSENESGIVGIAT